MSSLIPMAGSAALQNAQIRNQGGQAGWLGGPGAIDGSAQSFWNLADPANLTGKASSGHILSNILDPGNVLGMNQAANPNGANEANAMNDTTGMPAILPTLAGVGAPKTYDPNSFSGYTNLGAGPYNQMASQMAGPVYSPTLMQPTAPPGKGMTAAPTSGKGGGTSAPAAAPYRNTMPYFGTLKAK